MKNLRELQISETCGEKHKSGVCCCYFNSTADSCALFEKIAITNFEKLFNARCDVASKIRKYAKKIAYKKRSYLGDAEDVVDDLEQDAYEALIAKFQSGSFPFKYPNKSFVDIVSYACRVISNSPSGRVATIKKYLGKYCIFYSSAFGCSKDAENTKYGSKECADINPNRMEPPCSYFTPPTHEPCESDTGEDQLVSASSKAEMAAINQELETQNLVELLWINAKSVPEMRKVIRINKYLLLIRDYGGDDFKVSNLEEDTGIDHKTIKSDLVTWLEFKKLTFPQ